MPTQRISPAAISMTNLSGAVTDIDEPVPTAVLPTMGLVAHYPFDDGSGSVNDAVPVGEVAAPHPPRRILLGLPKSG